MHSAPTNPNDEKMLLRYSYTSLFILSFAYIMTYALASLFKNPWLVMGIQILSVVIPLLLARFVPYLRVVAKDLDIGFKPLPVLTSLWLLPVFIGLVIALSSLTTWFGSLFGASSTFHFGDNIWLCLLSSALLPALTEELFCRYIFLPRLSVYSKSGAIFASAIFFSFMHGNLFQIPYALVAGIFLGALAVCTGSVLPGIVFHLVNNVASILLHFYGGTVLPQVLLWVLVGGLVVSAVCAAILRRRIWETLRTAFACDTTTGHVVRGIFTSPIVIYLVIFIGMAIMERLPS